MADNTINFKDVLGGIERLTSFEFFNKIIPYFNNIFKDFNLNSAFVFNMGGITSIEPLVIPYLVSLGEWCNFKSNCKTVIRLPDDIQTNALKQYFSAINFQEHFNAVFNFEGWGYQSDENTVKYMDGIKKNTKIGVFEINKVCNEGTYCSLEYTRNDVWNYLAPIYYSPSLTSTRDVYFLDDLLGGREGKDFSSETTRILAELSHNALFHGGANCYLLCEYLTTFKLLKISLSDLGEGLCKTTLKKNKTAFKFKEQELQFFKNKDANRCLHALIESIMLRIWRKNGLFGVVYTILHNKGKIRIHTDTCQLVLTNAAEIFFTQEAMEQFSNNDVSIKKSFFEYLKNNIDNPKFSTIRNTAYFPGVHFEIEMPVPINFR